MANRTQDQLIGTLTTLCYLEQEGCYLMMHRVKKENDVNKDKWVGVGGHAERYESPEDCLLREVWEETGLRLTDYRFRGIVTFVLKGVETQYMCLYTATGWEGEISWDCPEGVLEWVPREKLGELPLWSGDHVFFRLLDEERPFFSLKMIYEGDRLTECVLDGKPFEVGPGNGIDRKV
ncbi:MAG: 8-oxo-dGTP diphosphatase [Eubacteriales bacterium]|nr:8-oxo-dGTP diphosphatase [Eubacteriales bacterium]